MVSFSISNGNSTSFTDNTPGTGAVIDFTSLDNSFSVQVNGVQLFVGGPAGAPNELEFQTPSTAGQTVRFADGDQYETNTPAIWQMTGDPVMRLEINPDGTIAMSGVKFTNGPLEPLELFNGMTVNSAAVAAAWNPTGDNTIVIDQIVTGPTNAAGDFDPLCFAAGTLIRTADGSIPVERLRVGDLVFTYDSGFQPVRWIGSCALSPARLDAAPRLRPILIRADALGPGVPAADLTVSPQHRVLVSSAIAKRMFGCDQVLIPARKLLPLPGVDIVEDNTQEVVYFHILLDDHQVISANGAPAESLFSGPEMVKSMSPEAMTEIAALFPEMQQPGFKPAAARHIPKKGAQMTRLIARHLANNKPLVCQGRSF